MKLDKYVQKFLIALEYTKSKHRLLQLICKKLQCLMESGELQPRVHEPTPPHSQPGSSLGAASNPGEEGRIVGLGGVGVVPRRPHHLSPKLKVSREAFLERANPLIKKK